MCYIATIIKVKDDKEVLYPILKALAGEQDSNDDGTGAYCFNLADKKSYYRREMKAGADTMVKNLTSFDICNYHFRSTTQGTTDISNVHFWEKENWLFAHNGTITDFAKDGKSDSLVYFEKLIEHKLLKVNGDIDIQGIQTYTNSLKFFYGRTILIYRPTGKMYFFGDFKTYLLNRHYLLVASGTTSFESYIYAYGIPFEVEDTETSKIEVLETEIDGVHSFDAKDGFLMLDTTFKRIYVCDDYDEWGNHKPAEKSPVEAKNSPAPATETPLGSFDYLKNQHIQNPLYDKEFAELTEKFIADYTELNSASHTEENMDKLEKLENKYYYALDGLDFKYAPELFTM